MNAVYEQMLIRASRMTRAHLHFSLSNASTEALNLLRVRDRLPIQPIPEASAAEQLEPKEHHDPDAVDTSAAGAMGAPFPEGQVFSDRSFMRASLASSVKKFMTALEHAYRSKGFAVVSSAGTVQLDIDKQSQHVEWKQLMERIPGFFQLEFAKLQGHRFSSAVHAKLSQMVPASSVAASSSVASRRCFGVLSVSAPAVEALRT